MKIFASHKFVFLYLRTDDIWSCDENQRAVAATVVLATTPKSARGIFKTMLS